MTLVHDASRAAVMGALPTGLARKFDPSAAGDLDATFELRVTGGDRERRFALHVADGGCTIERRPAPEARASVTISAGDIARLVTGTITWPALLAAHRLQLGGDPFVALRFPKLFTLPAETGEPTVLRALQRR
jgi:hypothetical protein